MNRRSLRSLAAVGVVTTAVAGAGAGVAMAHGSTVAKPADNPVTFRDSWKITKVGPKRITYNHWQLCAQVDGPGTGGCSHSLSVSNTTSGTFGVSDGVLSSTLGYSVTRTFTLTGDGSFSVPANKVANIYWRTLYYTREIQQTEYREECYTGGCSGGSIVGHAVGYASRAVSPVFRHSLVAAS